MKVSAIVSAYYAQDYILDRILNLQHQVPAPEIVVVAQKGSKEAEVARTHDTVLILTDDIPTIYAAWNMAIRAASGEYITNANCDDFTNKDAYQVMSSVLDKNPDIALVYSDNWTISEHGDKFLKRRPYASFKTLQNKCVVGPFPMWRKSLHDKYGYFDESYIVAGDYEFWLRIASHGEELCHIALTTGVYYDHRESAEHRNRSLAMLENIKVRNIYKDVLLETQSI
jgi:GT2 family glycosyltransferase